MRPVDNPTVLQRLSYSCSCTFARPRIGRGETLLGMRRSIETPLLESRAASHRAPQVRVTPP
jgi:hypothetical protein